ncbi:MAG TPA: SRPBCC family protein [Thermoleophilaceae bacterium]
MSSTVRASRAVVLPPSEAMQLWRDLRRWPTFVEGFAHVESKDDAWPADGTKLVWQSRPGGRGRVSEKVERHGDTFLAARVVEDAFHGRQVVRFSPVEGGGSIAELQLEYELNPTTMWRRGPVGWVTNLFFIRRAMTDSLVRTLRRFATEAAEQQSL